MTRNRPDNIADLSNLTRSQLLIWTGQRLQPDEPLYNMVLTFHIQGALDPATFQQAFQALLDRCDALRVIFTNSDGVPQQRFLEHPDYRVDFVDFASAADPEAQLNAWLRAHCVRCFDLGECLFESTLIKLASERFVWYLNQHHLITDAWSVSVLFQRMQELYGLARQGRLDEAKELPHYQDYVAYEREHRASPQYRKSAAYWKQKLEKPFIPSTFYRKTPAQRSGRTERVPCPLGRVRSARLKAMAEHKDFRAFTQDLSLFQIFATVLFAYLYRITGNHDLAIGTPSHNRASTQLKETAGLFIEVFPVQVQVQAGETFVSLFNKVAQDTYQFLLHATPAASSFEHSRAYDVLLNYITASFGDFDGLPMQSEWLHAGHGDRNHLLRLQVHDFDRCDELVLYFDFNVDVFVGEERHWVVQHFLRLLDAFLAEAHQEIALVSLLSAEEHQRLIFEYNQRVTAEPVCQSVVELIERQVECSPDRIALICDEQTLSYRLFNQRANQLAYYLRRRGVEPGVSVAISMTRSIESVIAIIGVLKSGAAYVPIDPTYPPERISLLLEDAQVSLVLTQAHLTERLPQGVAETFCLDTEKDRIVAEAKQNPPWRPGLEGVAYIIHTSGSTGRPKGVVVGHRGLANYLCWAKRYYLDGEVLDFPLFSSLSFDLTVTSTFVPLISGGKLIIYEEPGDVREITIQRVIEDNAVDIVKLTPVHLALIQSLDLSASRLKKLIVGGEDLKTDIARTIAKRFGRDIEIYNEYGPTEATVACMIHRFDPQRDTGASVPIGRAIDNLQIYVLDAHRNLVPPGVVGELFIGGAGVAKGYLNREQETAKRFVDNPFRLGEKMYATGDLARWNPDELLEFLGRKDHQVKIRGVRVELGEVEAALLEHEQIGECVVEAFERAGAAQTPAEVEYCVECGLASNHPDSHLDAQGVCRICRIYAAERDQAHGYFRTLEDLRAIAAKAKAQASGEHECIMLLSGGKDSTYALCQLVDLGLNPLVFTLDNGYISDGAKENIRRVVEQLGLELVVGSTAAMNAIFVDSLNRFSNVCNGCFKTIYTLSMNLAHARGIKYIVTGLSRGQIFETRLAGLFQQGIFDPERIDRTIIEARRAYHRMDDAVFRSLDMVIFQDDAIFEEIEFIDFYRYFDVELHEVLAYLDKQVPWIRPADTGRSTNCLINNVGIHVHKTERGYHNYALPYSWDVRLGHKQRDAARNELDDDIDLKSVNRILGEIGYQPDTLRPSDKRLAAYYVSLSELSNADLRTYLSRRLPGEFVPSYFMWLERLPLTPNDKVDRKALPRPDDTRPVLAEAYLAPTNPVEIKLAAVWAEILGIEKVGVKDNFFELGGDSILNIQIVARAKQQGIALTPQQIFEYPTIGELANVVGDVTVIEAEQRIVEGPVQLTPIQLRFFELNRPDPQHFNQAVLLAVSSDLDIPMLEAALQHLLRHHDGLRSRFVQEQGEWRQFIMGADDVVVSVECVNLSSVPAAEQDRTIDYFAAPLHASLDLSAGKLIRVACFERESGQPSLVLIVIHHLVVDGVSWWVLLEDLEMAYQQLCKGEDVRLAPKTTSLKSWSESLAEYARSPRVRDEAEYWTGPSTAGGHIPVDYSNGAANNQASAKTLSVSLSAEQTRSLLQEVPGAYRVQVPEVILTALLQSLSVWSGNNELRLELEGHGREEIVAGVDLLRTVGWFTTVYPVTLRLENAAQAGQVLKSIKEQLRAVPNRGIGFGVLRYLADADVRQKLADLPGAEVLFNYLGQWDRVLADSSRFRFARPIMGSFGLQGQRAHLLEINALIFEGQLRVDWTYSKNRHQESSIQQVADRFIEALQTLIDYCLSSQDHGHTPSDFPQADLNQAELDQLMADFGESLD